MQIKILLILIVLTFIFSCNDSKSYKTDVNNIHDDNSVADKIIDEDADETTDIIDNGWVVNTSIISNEDGEIYIAGYIADGSGDYQFVRKYKDGVLETVYKEKKDEWIVGIMLGNDKEIAIIFTDENEGSIEFLGKKEATINTGQCSESVWGTSFSNIYAAVSGNITYYNGSYMEKIEIPVTEKLKAVWGIDAENIYAAGRKGTLIHYDGEKWSEMESGTTEDLNSIWGSSENDIYISGGSENTGNHIILHFNGEKWETVLSDSGFVLLGIDGTEKNNVFAVGAGRNSKNEVESVILHYNGKEWKRMPTDIGNFLWDVQAMPDGSAYVVGTADTIEKVTP